MLTRALKPVVLLVAMALALSALSLTAQQLFVVSVPTSGPAQQASAGIILYQTAIFSGEASDIYSVNANGTNNKALTHDGRSLQPSWSPDGQRILFLHEDAVPAPSHPEHTVLVPLDLSVMSRDGSNPQLIRRLGRGIDSAAWSPDGKTLAVSYAPPNDTMSLFLLPADGVGEPRLLLRNAIQPAWAPGGKKIAAVVEGNNFRLTVMDVDGSNQIDLAVQADSPAWSPDGQEIAFGARRGGDVQANEQQIFITKIEESGSNVRQITDDRFWSFCQHPSWAPDGRRITFSCHTQGCFLSLEWAPNSPPRICMSRLFVVSVDDQYPKSVPPLVPLFQNDAVLPAFAPK